MKKLFAIALIIVFTFLGGQLAWADAAGSKVFGSKVFGSKVFGSKVFGSKVFSSNCAACHLGGGNVINSQKTLKKDVLEKYEMASIEAITTQVTKGKNAMPAFKGRLSDEQIAGVAAYVLEQSEQDWK